jgi:putative DNA primase/helicase
VKKSLRNLHCTCPRGGKCDKSPGKHPITEHGFKDATTDEATIRKWFAYYPGCNWAIRTGVELEGGGFLCALDIDPRNMGDDSLVDLEKKYGTLPETVRVNTGGGGVHYFFKTAKPIKSAVVAPGIELKGLDGYVVCDPSMHMSGRQYLWDVGAHPDDTAIVWMPDWLFNIVTKRANKWTKKVESSGIDAAQSFLGECFRIMGRLGEPIADGKRLVKCLWVGEHSDDRGDGTDSSTVLLPPTLDSNFGGFRCMHAHCEMRGWKEVYAAIPDEVKKEARRKFPPTKKQERKLSDDDVLPAPNNDGSLVPEPAPVPQGPPPEPGVEVDTREPAVRHRVRPTIDQGVDLDRVVKEAEAALGSDQGVFQRENRLVAVVRAEKAEMWDDKSTFMAAGTPQIHMIGSSALKVRLSGLANWRKYNARKNAMVACLPPDEAVSGLMDPTSLQQCTWPHVRTILGIIEAPSMRPDGTLIQEPGYDSKTGFHYLPSLTFPKVPESPTQEDAKKAYAALIHCLCDFPFVGESSKAVVIAAILTILVRPAIRGATPIFIFDKNTPGAGGTFLSDFVSIIATGRYSARMHYTSDEVELEKILGAYAIRGASLICFDNINAPFGGGPIDRVATARDKVELRVLGKSQIPELAWRAVMLGTGNNVFVKDETAQRVCLARLRSLLENPRERDLSKLKYPDLLAWTETNRADLVMKALTIVRAYVNAGRPKTDAPSWGSFEAWADLIPHAIVWAGGENPARITAEREASDGIKSAMIRLPEVWTKMITVAYQRDRLAGGGFKPRKGFSTREILSLLWPDGFTPQRDDGLAESRDVFDTLTGNSRSGIAPSAARLGRALSHVQERVFGGIQLVSTTVQGTTKWDIVSLPSGHTEQPAQVEMVEMGGGVLSDQPQFRRSTTTTPPMNGGDDDPTRAKLGTSRSTESTHLHHLHQDNGSRNHGFTPEPEPDGEEEREPDLLDWLQSQEPKP